MSGPEFADLGTVKELAALRLASIDEPNKGKNNYSFGLS